MADLPVHLIGCGAAETRASVAELGFKAFNLARLARLGVAVPPAMVLGTSWCRAYQSNGQQLPPDVRELLAGPIRRLEGASGLGFGNARRPLLVSVRSGAPVSMPGMMDTVLNVGLCESTLSGFLRLSGNPRLVWDSYRRLVESFADTVAGLPPGPFAAARAEARDAAGGEDLDFRALRALTERELELYASGTGAPFPQSAAEQLEAAVAAVFRSWDAPKARFYRNAHGIDAALGTAVTIQRMVFGNAGGTSGAGVGFTRNPSTGAPELYVDYAANRQGEDVVSGRSRLDGASTAATLGAGLHDELVELAQLLEQEFSDAQEFEFTVENGELFVLQTRDAKRTPRAALRIAVDLAEAGRLAPERARSRVASLDPRLLDDVSFDGDPGAALLATGVAASVGIVSGVAVFDPARAIARARAGEPVILVREDVATDDIAALEASEGLLAAHGARTSHAAVVARQLGKACIVACDALAVDPDGRSAQLGPRRLVEGDLLTLDAEGGRVFAGALHVVRRPPAALLARLGAL